MNKDQRNALRSVVTQCRRLLERSALEGLQGRFGIHPAGTIEEDARMTHLDKDERAARTDILDHFTHIKARGFTPKEALEQLVREVSFTHLNRLCAYKMMEARQVHIGDQRFREAVSRGVNSNGVKFFLADHPDDERLFKMGQQDIAYRHFLDWLGGMLSEEIGVLFSPHDPANRLYPPQRAIDDVLSLLNDEVLADIWTQDETIGWVYQYFTPKELRDQARKESQAPRNSYELAFRNQFFTPRYVVEFLTDNTLGRIWFEMRKGDTKLKDQCRYMVRRQSEVFLAEGQKLPKDAATDRDDLPQDELLKLPVYIPHRPKKDPRELKILDPACGSGHFLLYCFDLLVTIYEEAYCDPDLGPALKRDYPTLDALRRDVPRLILADNLHGIDIDLRASQIAALALWLRCQRAYQDMGLKKDRPKITRSNFVCAEPMPGEDHMLKEFVGQIQPKLLGQLVEVVFDKMKLAGEAGSLLKIEEEIRDAVAEARKQWMSGPVSIQRSLFDDDKPAVKQQRFDVSGITHAQFFEQAEYKVAEALRGYAERATIQQLQRRLFAEDAVRGFAFVDLCHKRFDVILMNPPFGDSSKPAKTIITKQYPRTKNDVYASFVERGLLWLNPAGMLGAITSRTGFFLSSFQKLREEILLQEASPVVFADLGHGVLDTAMVETAAYCVEASRVGRCTTFFRLLQADDKDSSLLIAIDAVKASRTATDVFHVIPTSFEQVPGSPFAYWVSNRVRRLFKELPPFESEERNVRVGVQTGDDFRFVRCWWEVSADKILDTKHAPDWRNKLSQFQQWCRERTFAGKRWVPFAKGGVYSTYFADLHLVVNWERDAEEIKALEGSVIRNADFYFRAGLTWSDRTTRLFSARCWPAGGVFSVKGSAGFFPNCEYSVLGLMNSTVFNCFLALLVGAGDAAARSYQVGVIGVVPFPPLSGRLIDDLVAKAIDCKRAVSTTQELSHLFVSPVVDPPMGKVDDLKDALDEIAFRSYGISAHDQKELPVILATSPDTEGEEDDDEDLASVDRAEWVRAQLSYAVGCVFGRWDIRFSTGVNLAPKLPDPFGPLPVSSPGMLRREDGLPLLRTPAGYPLGFDGDGILVDDIDHTDDIVRRVREVLEMIWKDRADDIDTEACEILGVKEVRDYFRKPGKGGFWDDHMSRYTKSRRKAPIYWLLQSSKKNYAIWLYYHRLDKDLLFKALVNYVEPKIRLEDSRLEALRTQKAAAGGSGRDAKRLGKDVERQEEFLSELRDFEDKLRRTANLHLEPDLNDGVVLNAAPLWELVPWKEAKSYWQELLDGKYEWSSIGRQLREKELVK